MLLVVCACAALAAARAAGFDNQRPAVPVFRDVYTVTGVQYDLIQGLRLPFTNWYDGKNNRTRMDDCDQHTIRKALIRIPDQLLSMMVYPNTTEEHVNQMACDVVYIEAKGPGILPDVLPYIGTDSTYIGKERFHDSEAFHWRTKWNSEITTDAWITYRNSTEGGEPVAVPLRYKSKEINWNGYILYHYMIDYFDFQVYDTGLDPEIFNITKGLSCNETHNSQRNNSSATDHTRVVTPPISDDSNEFELYKMIHKKQYASRDEYEMRMNIYRKNVELIERHNRGNHSYKLAVNQFADRTREELRSLLGYRAAGRSGAALEFPHSKAEVEELSKDLPEKFDWRWTPGVVKRVKDQQFSCAGDWAFATTGAIEGVNAIVNGGYKPQLSEQALIDCSWGFQNYGCSGGSTLGAFEYVKKHGIPTYSSYGRYEAMAGFCRIGNVTNLIRITDFHAVTPNDVKALKLTLFKYGPVAVIMEIRHDFFFYSHGVYHHPNCWNGKPNHELLAVGWGELEGQKYWIVKNSWGNRWGDNGYALLDMDNDCGIRSAPHYVTIDKHGD